MTLKTLKANSNNTSKDVLLHQIFDEISEEYKEVNGDGYLDEIIPLPQQELSKIRETQKIRQWIFITFLSIAIIYVLFATGAEKNEEEDQKVVLDRYTVPEVKKTVKKEVKESPLPILSPSQIMDTPNTPQTNSTTLKIEEMLPKVVPVPTPQTPREKAKALLRLQLAQ